MPTRSYFLYQYFQYVLMLYNSTKSFNRSNYAIFEISRQLIASQIAQRPSWKFPLNYIFYVPRSMKIEIILITHFKTTIHFDSPHEITLQMLIANIHTQRLLNKTI